MTLRDQIKQKQLPFRMCGLTGLALNLPTVLFGALHGLGLADPWEGGYFGLLVMLSAVGVVVLLIWAFGHWSIRCPKCRALLGEFVSSKERYCRYCGADFDAEV